MEKEVIINTNGLNCYGSRVLTSGIDLTQYRRNPILLWMHRRPFEGREMPIGRMENLRIDGDLLIGTPVFDRNDEFARRIADKWENGFLRMASAGLEIVETSMEPEHLLPGQTRATVTRSKLIEVSIVDIGGNDDALQLYDATGRIMRLSTGEPCNNLPLLLNNASSAHAKDEIDNKHLNPMNQNMNKELLELLGLPETTNEQEVTNAVRLLKQQADEAETLRLASIATLVDHAIAEKRLTADQKDHFLELGKKVGAESLAVTLSMMQPARKPMDLIHQTDTPPAGKPDAYLKLSDVPAEEIPSLKEKNPSEYSRLYKAEYGIEV